ncbi:P-loop containing nucleoside triphosphate hydrolase protein [Mycena galopus ATCC 62051]|nr:P-loop containing nucleoside triphosphate hydrolase protein [Mycena galopus ATCC 62051]
MPPRRLLQRVPQPKDTPNKCLPLTKKELEGLEDNIKAKFQWAHTINPHQLEAIVGQLQMRDVLVHTGTGSGKTAIAAGPHAHKSSEGKVRLMISPFISLHDEQVNTFREEFKLKAIAVNSSNGGCKVEVLKVLSVVVDEAHVVSHWGVSFRKKYGTLGIIRAFLPQGTPIVALSTTLPARIRTDVLSKLQFGHNYISVNIGNDRPNVSLVVRAIQHPLNTYADLDFVVDGIMERKAFVYVDNIATGVEIQDHLEEALLPELRGKGLIHPYNAALSKEYRREAMRLFKSGKIRVLVCTDAAGLGCNILDIDLVVQWKLPGSVSIFVQRAGRVARGPGRSGLAVLLVEQSAYGIDVAEEIVEKTAPARVKRNKGKGKAKANQGAESEAAKKWQAQKQKAHAKTQGVNRGSVGGKHDAIFNQPPVPTAPCCDICCPHLLDLTQPGKLAPVARQSAVKRGEVNMDVQMKLNEWRTEIKTRDFPGPLYAPLMILKDETVALLASVGPIMSLIHLQKTLSNQWLWIDEYGAALYQYMSSLSIPEMKLLPKKTRGPKHSRKETETADANGTAVVGSTDERGPSMRRRGNKDDSAQPLITAASSADAGTSHINPVPVAQKQNWKTAEEIWAEFEQLPASSLFLAPPIWSKNMII